MAFRSTVSALAPRMLRASAFSASRISTATASPLRSSMIQSSSTLKLTAATQQQRCFASGGGLSHQQIQDRITEVLKSFEKVNPAKLSASSSFTSDLGLDSLDAVEVVMAIEEEFSIEIPDAEADNITTVQQAIDYISKTPEAI